MTQTTSRTQAKATAAMRRVESYRKQFGYGHIYLACYAALPLALTPDLLYRRWANFQRDVQGELLNIPWIAVSDLLLSNLCEEVGEELYEMKDEVREVLLKELRSLPQLGEARLKAVAEFVLAYVEPQLNSPDSDVRDLAEVQQWRSLAYVEPEAAARAIAVRLAGLNHGDQSEWLRMARLVEPLAEPLAKFGALVDYTRGMAAFVRGQREVAISPLQRALGEKRKVEVAGVRLPLPEGLQSLLQPEIPKVESTLSWVDFLLRNRRWVGSGAGLLVMVGSGVYWWYAHKSSPNSVSNFPTSSPSPTPIASTSPTIRNVNAQPSASPTPSLPTTSPSPSPIASTPPVTGTVKVQSPDSPPSTSPSPSPIASTPPVTGTVKVQSPDSAPSTPPSTSPSPSPIVSTVAQNERAGFQAILDGDLTKARNYFGYAYAQKPTYNNVDEIYHQLLTDEKVKEYRIHLTSLRSLN